MILLIFYFLWFLGLGLGGGVDFFWVVNIVVLLVLVEFFGVKVRIVVSCRCWIGDWLRGFEVCLEVIGVGSGMEEVVFFSLFV